MLMSQQQCDLHAGRLRNAPNVFSGVVDLNSHGALVFCPSGTNGGVVNADRDGLEISAQQAKILIDAGAMDLRPLRA
jgi:hypothetical protein